MRSGPCITTLVEQARLHTSLLCTLTRAVVLLSGMEIAYGRDVAKLSAILDLDCKDLAFRQIDNCSAQTAGILTNPRIEIPLAEDQISLDFTCFLLTVIINNLYILSMYTILYYYYDKKQN